MRLRQTWQRDLDQGPCCRSHARGMDFGGSADGRALLGGRDCDRAGIAVPNGLARDGLQSFAKAEFDAGEIAIVATDGDLVGGHSGVDVGEELLDLNCALAAGLRGIDHSWRDVDGLIGVAHRAEILVRGEAGAGAVLGPFMCDQTQVGHDVEHGGWIRQAGRVRTLRRPLAVRVLRP